MRASLALGARGGGRQVASQAGAASTPGAQPPGAQPTAQRGHAEPLQSPQRAGRGARGARAAAASAAARRRTCALNSGACAPTGGRKQQQRATRQRPLPHAGPPRRARARARTRMAQLQPGTSPAPSKPRSHVAPHDRQPERLAHPAPQSQPPPPPARPRAPLGLRRRGRRAPMQRTRAAAGPVRGRGARGLA